MAIPSADGAPDLKRLRRQKAQDSRLPPSNAEAEQGILGCCLMDNACIGKVIEAFRGSVEILYDLRNRTILETMIALYEDRDPIDTITLSDRLKAFDLLESVGGIAYISVLPDAVPSVLNLDYYIGIIRDCYLRRKMIATATEVVSNMYDLPAGDLGEALDMAERSILQVSESRVEEKSDTIKSVVDQAMWEMDQAVKNRGTVSGLATGFSDFDRMTDGLHPGEMIIIAARPSLGKTSLCMNIAESIGVVQRLPVGVLSLEMTKVELIKRMICARAKVNLRNVKEGFSPDEDLPKLRDSASNIRASPLFLDDKGGISILELRAKARRMWQQNKLKLLVIDYLQLAHGIKAESRQQEVAQVSNGIKNLAKELEIPIIVAAQLNRDIERDKNRMPRLADLRESGSIEQDADVVTFLYRPGTEKEPDMNEKTFQVNWLVCKNRNGPTGLVRLTFNRTITRFELAAKIDSKDVPEQKPQQREFQQ